MIATGFHIPECLASPRLDLRLPLETDWRAMHGYYSDPACMRYTIGRALTEGESWRMTATLAGHWMFRHYGPYVLERRQDRRVVGVVGFWYPGDWPEPEIKWGILRSEWRKGYASEAARAVLGLARAVCADGPPPISLIHAENHASIGVAQRLGATWEKDVEFRGAPFRIFRHHPAHCLPRAGT